MDLSIVIVSWNTRQILHDCLKSVYSNLGQVDAEVIVVDNASGDGSPEMVEREFPDATLIGNHENHGFAVANNQAIEVSRGTYILLLNPDTIVLGDVLENSVSYMKAHPDVGVFGCRVLNPDLTLQSTCFQYPSLMNSFLRCFGLHLLPWPPFFGRERYCDWQRDSERDVDVVTGCYFMVRRSALEEVGLLDPAFFLGYEETDWCVRFGKANWRLRFAPVGEIIHLENASGRQISHKRDIHLAEGKVRLHAKHSGAWSAGAVWALAWLFFVNRLLITWPWLIAGPTSHRATRAREIIRVLREFPHRKMLHNHESRTVDSANGRETSLIRGTE